MKQTLTKEQVEEIKRKMAEMPPEKLKELIKQQCLFCQISYGNVPSKKVYEDDKIMAVLDINPASNGHTLVFTKDHYQVLAQMPDTLVGYLFKVVNKLSSRIFDVLKADGINIFVASGQLAGQNAPHAIVHIIPRYEQDNIPLSWNPTKVSDGELDKVKASLEVKKKLVEEDVIVPQFVETQKEEKSQKTEKKDKLNIEKGKRVPI